MNAVSTLDDRTASAIRDAIRAATAGRLGEAAEIGERALADGGDPAALNAMLGSFRCRAGELEAGIRHLRAAHAARPADPVIAFNLASALAQNGEFEAVLAVLPESLVRSDPSLRLERVRAYAAQMAEKFEEAIGSYERVVAAEPNDWEAWNNLGNSRRLSGDFEGSVAALKQAADLCPDSPPVRLNHALAVASAGRIDEAEQLLREMAEGFAHDVKALTELHSLYKGQLREQEALEAIETAVGREPRNVDLLLGLASHLLSMLRNDDAERTYREAIAVEPDNGPANLGLALSFELTNRGEELSQLVEEAEGRGVPTTALSFIKAFDHRRNKRFAEGLEAMKEVPEELETARRWHLLGQLNEGVGNYDEAFAAFERMNQIQSEDVTRPQERAVTYRNIVRSQKESLSADWMKRLSDVKVDDGRASPVFLVGFPRSGTTLLDTILMAHPDTEVLEEEPTLLRASKLLPVFNEIPEASEEQVRKARDEYFRVAGELIPLAPGKLLVDKNPLSMNGLPVIRKLFPDARVILALRHPCDVVLSCFVTNFKLNDGMSSFLRLDTAAELYDLSFSYLEKARSLVGLPIHEVVYERLVEDREGELRSLLDFLGLEWSDEILDHQATALSRGRIKTASYAQVAQPIYQQSAGRWQNYRKHLEPILPVLEPWASRFGYPM